MLNQGQVLGEKHTTEIDEFLLQTLKAPGLRTMTQVELYKNFNPFVPHQYYWDGACPLPSGEVLARVKDKSTKK
jgi:hypothetical protein